jgi:nicastrin
VFRPMPMTMQTTALGKQLLLLCAILAATTTITTNHGVLAVSTPSLEEPFQTSFEHLPHDACVSLFHRNGRVGCGTLSRSTMTGRVVHWSAVVGAEAEADDDNNGNANGDANGNAGKLPPYVAVMDETDFTAANVAALRSFADAADAGAAAGGDGGREGESADANEDGAGVLRGLLVVNATAAEGSSYGYYSPEAASPQGDDTPSANVAQSSYEWNPNGDGNTMVDYHGLPVVYVSKADVAADLYSVSMKQSAALQRILDGDDSVGDDDLYPAIMAEFNYYMGPDNADSPTCLAWRDVDESWAPKCLPLAGNSVWAVAGSPAGDAGRRRRLEDQQQQANNGNGNGNGNGRPIVMMATSIDSTSMFHDASPGANSAATNILALLMAAKLVGTSLPDTTLDGLSNRIMFGFFQAESYGFVGSRSFLRDVAYPGFQCDEGRTVPAVAKDSRGGDDNEDVKMGCLNPLRTDMDFMKLGEISGMIAVDQVGVLGTDRTFYVHGENAGGNDNGFLANVLLQLGSNDWTIASSAAENDDNGQPAIPPTPLQSLIKLSEGAVGGAVLSGYDEAFVDASYYHSHLDSNATRPVNLNSVAMAATVLARAAVASAYDNGEGDAESAAQFAANLIPDLSTDDETFLALADCLLTNGNCDLLLSYGKMERINNEYVTGVDLGLGIPLGTPPNYYPSVYDASNGQGFVQVGTKRYGSYTGDEEYGKAKADTFLLRPSLLEMSIHGMLDDFLGRGSVNANGDVAELKSCKSSKACSSVSYCSATGDEALCSGDGVCVCSRAHYHVALDEAIVPAPNNFTGRFLFDEYDQGVSPVFTEPYWSSSVGVRVYRDAGGSSGNWALGAGLVVWACSLLSTILLKKKLKKEKLY